MKKAMVLVCFGTSHLEAKHYSIDKIAEDLEEQYPDYDHFLSFTSKMIIKKLEEMGIEIDYIDTTLEKLYREGYDEIVLVPTHLIEGDEFKKIEKSAGKYLDKFDSLKIVKPVLSDIEGMESVVDFLENQFYGLIEHPRYFLLLMGHGSESAAKETYRRFNDYLRERGHEDIFLACVEGEPSLEEATGVFDRVGKRKIAIVPLMLVAGEHIRTDLLDEGGWVKRLRKWDYSAYPLWLGLGEYQGYRNILTKRIEDSLNE